LISLPSSARVISLAVLIAGSCSPAAAQSCVFTTESLGNQKVQCPGGLSIVVEKGAEFHLSPSGGARRPGAAELTDKAILVESPPGRAIPFRVLTPQAIAAVRGTVWAVDVTERGTAVFTQRGRVEVRRASGPAVVLGPGEGVDVADEASSPLTVKRWGEARVRALLSRLGR
jgi:ferric-dicitrate binding protein FerR (iron transport regulator)